ncbi:hypothetical protein [Clostridium nigeriense]|uniref:hypothetical protein n=1 Tax=Clostridium nigeriense TaxID=1805470 RepID=UPI00082A041D|nr:hypothetical protein [Clostridium nigeriense]
MIKEKVDFLISMNDEEWGQYAFSRDPLKGKVSYELRKEMIEKANECGKKEAIKLKEKYKDVPIKKIIKRMNIDYIEKNSNVTETYIMFACYNSPNKITIFKKNKTMVEEFIKENDLSSKLEYIDVESVLLAHELFHHIEENNKDIYTKNEKVVLWKIGSYKYKSGLVCIGEIAAMAFAKELLSINYNPYVFDVLMLYPHDKNKATELYKEIEEFKGGL